MYFGHILVYAFRDDMENQPGECAHSWWVYSTATEDVTLEVTCMKCETLGSVSNPSPSQWKKAYDAPACPYKWRQAARVEFTLDTVEDKQKHEST